MRADHELARKIAAGLTPGSLAWAVRNGRMDGMARAAAVERLTRAAATYLQVEGGPGEDEARAELCSALADSERWSR